MEPKGTGLRRDRMVSLIERFRFDGSGQRAVRDGSCGDVSVVRIGAFG
jgi:hypothetical protein